MFDINDIQNSFITSDILVAGKVYNQQTSFSEQIKVIIVDFASDIKKENTFASYDVLIVASISNFLRISLISPSFNYRNKICPKIS